MIAEITNYLRSTAHTCILLARACPDMATARSLEEVAIDLMAEAKESGGLYAGEGWLRHSRASDIDACHLRFGIAQASDRADRNRLFDCGKIGRTQPHRQRTDILVKPRRALGTRD